MFKEMRLLIYGSLRNTNTIASFFVRHLGPGVQYQILRFPDQFSDLLRSKYYRLLYRFYPLLVVRRMDKSFLRQIEDFHPTVILIFKGMEISEWSLKRARRKGIKLVNYNFDHPYEFFSRGTGNRFVKASIPFYDLHISYSSAIAKNLAEKFCVQTAWLPFGFHLTSGHFQEVIQERRPEINRVCFVGNPDELRIVKLRRLVTEGIPISLYGFGWEKIFESNDRVEIHLPRKSGSFWGDPVEFWKVLRQYRVQLNFFRPHNEGSHNLRTFEVPAVGGILLTPASSEQEEFFEAGVDIFTYAGLDDLVYQCKLLLNMEQHVIDEMRIRAREKSLANDYSYDRRTRDLLRLLASLQISA
jgi:spore maturation protein CgeB